MLPVIVATIVALAVFLGVGTFMAPRLALQRHRARLRSLPAAELALEACRCADAAGIRRHFPEARLFSDHAPWTHESLARALDELHARLAAEDRRSAEAGPGSWVYYWYDFGLASVRELLDERRRSS
jgi:hypothetical protein